MQQKLISIIIPIYNCEKFLNNCIDSVISQSYKNIEIILVNDGSTDNSLKICKDYEKKDNRILIIDKMNGGVSSARNAGLTLATGDYILFLDSDDFLNQRYVKTLYDNTSNNNDKTMIMCNIKRFTNELDLINQVDIDNGLITMYENDQLFKLYLDKLLNPPYCKLYKRTIIFDNNIKFDETLSLGEDLLFNLQYITHIDKAIVLADCLYNYRVGNNNSLSRKYYSNMLQIQDKLCREFRKKFKNIDQDLLNRICIDFYITAVSNEFHRNNVNILTRYFNAKKILKNNLVKNNIEKCKSSIGKINYFLLKHNMVFTFLVYKKMSKK